MDAHRIMPMPEIRDNPFGCFLEQLAKTLFEQTHLVWSQEEVDKHWADPEYKAEVNQYRNLAKISIDFLLPLLERF